MSIPVNSSIHTEGRKNNNFIKNIVIVTVYAIITAILVFHNEIWRDEAQVWVLLRDSSFFELIRNVRIEGHPLLWYLIVLPFTKILNFSNAVFSMQILNWLIMLIATVFLVFKSPFNYFVKTTLLISSGFLYWYPVIARSYCLIPLLMFLLAHFFPKQNEKPFIYAFFLGLLAHTHVIMYGFCTILTCIFCFRTKNIYAKVLLIGAMVILPLYLLGSITENTVVHTAFHFGGIEGPGNIYREILFNIFETRNIFVNFSFSALLVVSLIVFFKSEKAVLWAFVVNFLYQFSVYLFIWGLIPQRGFILLLTVVFGFWIVFDKIKSENYKKALTFLLVLNLILTMPSGFEVALTDLKTDYSGGKKMAQFIEKNVEKDAVIISLFPLMTPSISAYLPENKKNHRFYYSGYEDFYTFIQWNKTTKMLSSIEPVMKYKNEYEHVYIILSANTSFGEIKPLFETIGENTQENFRLYKVKDNAER